MIDKIKSKAKFYWDNHKVCVIIVAILIVAYIVK
jgi:hypothetical protein